MKKKANLKSEVPAKLENHLSTKNMENLNLKMELFTKANGKIVRGMVKESRYGLMVLVTKENGLIIKLTDEGFSSMSMGMFLKVNGLVIKLMVMESIITQMAVSMRVIGLMIFKTVKVKKPGKTNQHMKDSIKKVKNMEKEYIFGLMAQSILVTG